MAKKNKVNVFLFVCFFTPLEDFFFFLKTALNYFASLFL